MKKQTLKANNVVVNVHYNKKPEREELEEVVKAYMSRIEQKRKAK